MDDPLFGIQGVGEGRPVPRGRFVLEEVPEEKRVVILKYTDKLTRKKQELVVPRTHWQITVGDLKRAHAKALGLPLRTAAYVNGVRVQDGCRLEFGDVISFVELGPCEV